MRSSQKRRRGAGFSAEAAARILHSEDCLAKETEALLPRVRRTSVLFGFLKAHAQDPLPLFCAGLAAEVLRLKPLASFLNGCAAALRLLIAAVCSVGAVAVVSAAVVLCVRGAYA